MKIGIIGTGNIGTSLVQKLSSAGHAVKVANSRGPDAVEAQLLTSGARATTAAEAVVDVDVVILSVPLAQLVALAPLLKHVSAGTVVIDTSNYYPQRDGVIEAIEAGAVESEWVAKTLDHPVIKAWNAIGTDSLARKGQIAGSAGRIAIPVAGDDPRGRQLALALVNDTGFDGFDAGDLSNSWRQQPGAPAYCTDLTWAEMAPALAAAERPRLAKRRDLALAVLLERLGEGTTSPDADLTVRITRAINL